MTPTKPSVKPQNPRFSSGPCAKRPGWSLAALSDAKLGISHRAKAGKAKLAEVIERSKALLQMPADWRLAIVPGSDTGAVEMALWSLLGPRGVTVLAFEAFGKDWASDIVKQLRLNDVVILDAPYGALPDLGKVDGTRDLVFTWNGTTSGVRLTNGDFISTAREGLAICDATSAAFAMDLPWEKLDVVTWSWQKALGGEAAHGMLALSPRAAERLEFYSPPWPMPKIFRMTKDGKLNEGLFQGETINTPSLLAVEDALDGLKWADGIGGPTALKARAQANLAVIEKWLAASSWAAFLAQDAAFRSPTSICLKIVDPWFATLSKDRQVATAKRLAQLVEQEGAGLDIASYRDAPPGLRIWGGATVESSDIEKLLPWLDWAYLTIKEKGAP